MISHKINRMRTIEENNPENLGVENKIGPTDIEDIMIYNSRDRIALLIIARKEASINNQELMVITKTISKSNTKEKNKNISLNTPRMRKSKSLESVHVQKVLTQREKVMNHSLVIAINLLTKAMNMIVREANLAMVMLVISNSRLGQTLATIE